MKAVRAVNLTIRQSVNEHHADLRCLVVTWDVVDMSGENVVGLLMGKIIFHKFYREDQIRETFADFARERKKEWKETSKFPTTFITQAKERILTHMRELADG